MTRRRHRRRGGRPRKSEAERHPSGQIKREARHAGPTAETMAHRAAELQAAGASPLDGGRQEAGWHLGRLYLAGKLDSEREGDAGRDDGKERYRAAERLWKNTQRYAGLLLGPRPPGAMSLGEPKGRSNANDALTFVRVKARHDASFEALQAKGYRVLLATSRALNEEAVPLPWLLAGLDALVEAEQEIRREIERKVERLRRIEKRRAEELAESDAA